MVVVTKLVGEEPRPVRTRKPDSSEALSVQVKEAVDVVEVTEGDEGAEGAEPAGAAGARNKVTDWFGEVRFTLVDEAAYVSVPFVPIV